MKLPKWPTYVLGDLVSFKSGGTPSRERADYWNGNIPWFSGKDLKSLHLEDSIQHISPEAIGKGTRMAKKGTILVLVRGMTLMKEVPIGLLDRDATFNQDIKGLVSKNGDVEPRFLAYYLRAENQRIRNSVTVAGHGTGRLPLEALEEYPVSLPPLPEQRKIAGILSTWDDALETLDALIATKTRQKQALMQQLLTGKTRVKGAKGKWKKVRMNELLERVFRPIEWSADMSLSLISIRRRCGGLFRRPEMIGSEYKTQDLHVLKSGDFLVSKRQVVHGAWAMVTPEFEGGHVSKEYAIFTSTAREKLHMPFFAWLAQTPHMIHLARVASTGVHIEKLIFDPAVFLRESIRIPTNLEEQQRIAAILDAADHELTLLRTQRQTLDQQKRGLMQRLLTGKTRVKP